jgi:predicted transcriptional regulator YdeE
VGREFPAHQIPEMLKEKAMQPKIIDKDQIILLGLSFYGDPFDIGKGWTEGNEIGRLWKRFMAKLETYGAQIKNVRDSEVAYEVHIENEQTQICGEREVFVGVEVTQLDHVPVDLSIKLLPATKYAAFTLKGEKIVSDWFMEIDQWIQENGYQYAYNYSFQYYDPRFKGLDRVAESELDVYFPIKAV